MRTLTNNDRVAVQNAVERSGWCYNDHKLSSVRQEVNRALHGTTARLINAEGFRDRTEITVAEDGELVKYVYPFEGPTVFRTEKGDESLRKVNFVSIEAISDALARKMLENKGIATGVSVKWSGKGFNGRRYFMLAKPLDVTALSIPDPINVTSLLTAVVVSDRFYKTLSKQKNVGHMLLELE